MSSLCRCAQPQPKPNETCAQCGGWLHCGFCKGKPVGNANRWYGSTQGPATLPCPRCGETNEPKGHDG